MSVRDFLWTRPKGISFGRIRKGRVRKGFGAGVVGAGVIVVYVVGAGVVEAIQHNDWITIN